MSDDTPNEPGGELVPLHRKPWDKQPGETAKAFQAFCLYRDLGPNRSQSKVGEQLGLSRGAIEARAGDNNWVERAEAYDADQDVRLREVRDSELEKAARRHVQLGALLSGPALKRLAGVGKAGEAGYVEALDPAGLDAGEVARLAEVGFRIERTALGMPTDLTKSLDMLTSAEAAAIISEIVDVSLARIPDDQHEPYLREVQAIGGRRR